MKLFTKYLISLFLIIICSLNAIGQSSVIRGKVTDINGSSLSGVSILALKTRTGSVTGKDGTFSISLTLPDTLLITHTSYADQRLSITRLDTSWLVVMTPNTIAMEVVEINTGYQRVPVNMLNGSYTVIDSEKLGMSNSPNILERLNGLANGLTFQVGRKNDNPQSSTGITIRGYSTINGPLDPLIVVDNFVYEGDIENINPNDVESVTILKDAEATSVYGARGGNGVIVITLKKGVPGPTIRVDGTISSTWSSKSDLHYVPMMQHLDYIDMEEFLFRKGYFTKDLQDFSRTPVTPIVYLLNEREQGRISDEEYQAARAFYEATDLTGDYRKNLVSDPYHQQVGIRLSGGSTSNTWSLSGNIRNNRNSKDSRTKHHSFRFSHEWTFHPAIRIQTGGSYSYSATSQGGVTDLSTLYKVGNRQVVPYMSLFAPDGSDYGFSINYSRQYLDTVGSGLLKDWYYYPKKEREWTDQRSVTADLTAHVGTDITVLPGLKWTSMMQIQRQEKAHLTHYWEESYFVRNLSNQFAQINLSNGTVTHIVPEGGIYNKSVGQVYSASYRSHLHLNKAFFGHRVVGMVGAEFRSVDQGGDAWRYYGYKADPLSFRSMNYNTTYPRRPEGSGNPGGSPIPETTVRNRFVSLYGNFNYSYQDTYFLSGSLRNEASNLYGVKTNDRWNPLWSVGAGFDLKKGMLSNSTFLDMLKLKITYGYSGNVDLSRSALPVAVFQSPFNSDAGGLSYAKITTVNNPRLRWEKVGQTNYAAEFSMFGRRLEGSLAWYEKRGKDLYGPSEYDYTNWGGRGTVMMNIANMSGKGLDVQVRYQLIQSQKVRLATQIIYNHNVNRTTKYHATFNYHPYYSILSNAGVTITPVEGMIFYPIVAFSWAGLDDQGNPMVYHNGQATADYNQVIQDAETKGSETTPVRLIGSGIPLHFGAWSTDLQYRRFRLAVNFTYKLGYFFPRTSINYHALVDMGAGHPDYAQRWQKPGDELRTEVPSFVYPLPSSRRQSLYSSSDLLIEKADHVRLQYVRLTYDISGLRELGRGINRMELYASASDLGIIWRKNRLGLDPDYAYGEAPMKSLSMGLNIVF